MRKRYSAFTAVAFSATGYEVKDVVFAAFGYGVNVIALQDHVRSLFPAILAGKRVPLENLKSQPRANRLAPFRGHG